MAEETTQTEQPVENSTNEAQQQDTQAKLFEIPTEAQELVGEGKKYANAEDALRSVPHAQKHIQTLETEMAELKEELSKRKTTQELLDELKSETRQPVENTTQEAGLNEDAIMSLVNQTLQRNEQTKTAKANADSVAKRFQSKYGSEAETVYNKLAGELGMSTQQLNSLATSSPSVVLRLAGLTDSAPANVAKSSGSVNTESLAQTKPTGEISARVGKGKSTKDLVNAWRAAGEKIKQQA
jgi:vacuolar-type H+-ATPase subunit I/STV1